MPGSHLAAVFSPCDGANADVVDRVGQQKVEPGLHPGTEPVSRSTTQLVGEGFDVRNDRVRFRAAVGVDEAGHSLQFDLQSTK